MTPRQKAVLAKVIVATTRGQWYRAGDVKDDGRLHGHGERVTLASLHSHGLLVRRAWRGVEGERDAAHEYQAARHVLDVLRGVTTKEEK